MKTLTKELIAIIVLSLIVITVAVSSYSYGKHKGYKPNDSTVNYTDTIRLLHTTKFGDKIFYKQVSSTQIYWVENEVGAIKQLSTK